MAHLTTDQDKDGTARLWCDIGVEGDKGDGGGGAGGRGGMGGGGGGN